MKKLSSHFIKITLIVLCLIFLCFHFTKKPYFSIIISSYNYAHFLPKTIESVLESTFKNYEIIIVNDGSTDNTSEILKRYKNHPKITIIEHENQGLSLSRNKAMKLAKGKYFWFVDADDWIDRRALERLYNKTKNKPLDIVSFYTCNVDENGNFRGMGEYDRLPIRLELRPQDIFTIDELTVGDILSYPVTSGKQIYRREFVQKNKIEFPPRTLFEDDVFFLDNIFSGARISVIKSVLYNKRSHSGAITADKSRFYDSYLRIAKYIYERTHKNKKNTDKANGVSNIYINGIFGRWYWNNDEQKQKFYPDLVKVGAFINSQPNNEYWIPKKAKFKEFFNSPDVQRYKPK